MIPELLAPAGDWDCLKAAVENGADAIYFGLERFNARMRAENFTVEELPRIMAHLHGRGVRGYVTLNTLIFPEEWAEVTHYLQSIIQAGADGVIVQDVGICRLIRQLSPDFPIHASTQMTITSPAGVNFARELGCSVVVLARECSLQEIAQLQPSAQAMQLEVFVHGALCVAYSGQCLTSESLGGRSANRGECAQACRMPYELIADGQVVPLGDQKYLLSPQDLMGLEVLPELVRLGIATLKIEGRLKSAEYVANITHIYRRALDKALGRPDYTQPIQDRYELEMSFSRGLYSGWFRGIDNQALVHARFGKKRGVYLGEVTAVRPPQVTIALCAPLKPGDGVVFDGGHPELPEEGGAVYSVRSAGPDMALEFANGSIDFRRLRVGDKVWKTHDPQLVRRVRQQLQRAEPQYQRPIQMVVTGTLDQPLTVQVQDGQGHQVELTSGLPLVGARQQPLTTKRLREQLGRLGGTAFYLDQLDNQLEGEVLLPVKELNRLRREVVEKLMVLRQKPRSWQLNGQIYPNPQFLTTVPPTAPQLRALVRSLPQLNAALASGLTEIYCELEDPRRYREAVTLAHGANAQLWAVPPRIHKPEEDGFLRQIHNSNPDGYLVRNYDHLAYFQGALCVGDFSLNIANPLSAQYFKDCYDLLRLTASYDLDHLQLTQLLEQAPPHWFEVTIHQHMPMFHMEHCVFCAFLSDGSDYTDCGRPCDKYEVRLRDRVGSEHVLRADVGCRNTVFNGRAQTGAEYVDKLLTLGCVHFRVEFVQETPAEVGHTLQRYQALLAGEITGSQLWRELKLQRQLGVTRGFER